MYIPLKKEIEDRKISHANGLAESMKMAIEKSTLKFIWRHKRPSHGNTEQQG
jgi:hypothetical protein